MNYKAIIVSSVFLCLSVITKASEGMWIPSLLNMDEMKAQGLKLKAEDIYSVNQSSLKDAIVHFGRGCTGEVISDQGLILTNYHCGYSQVQQHSSLENDYLKNGFWAMSKEAELPNSGLTVTFIKQIIDVSSEVLEGIDASTSKEEAEKIKKENKARLIKMHTDGTHYEAKIYAFNFGNDHFLYIQEVFRDIRLVGAPPSAIGKFGGDTDNWIWPRHTGDFSLFRIYASPDGKPAEYAPENVPYKPLNHLRIDLDGVEEGDFTMVYGFPGTTRESLIYSDVEYVMEVANPMRIEMRERSLELIDAAMREDDKTRIQYASKQARISNKYKKWIGQNQGLFAFDALEKKKQFEADLQKSIDADPTLSQYKNLIADINSWSMMGRDLNFAKDLYTEFYYYGPEILRYGVRFQKLMQKLSMAESDAEKEEIRKTYKESIDRFFKDYNLDIDRSLFKAHWDLYAKKYANAYTLRLNSFNDSLASFQSSEEISDYLYNNSMLLSDDKAKEIIDLELDSMQKVIISDPVFQISMAINADYKRNVQAQVSAHKNKMDSLMGQYLIVQELVDPDKIRWPEANNTLRVSFGKAEGSRPRDGMSYLYASTIEGIIQKNNSGKADFEIPERLRSLYENKDYGIYVNEEGKLPVCFLGSNHTTGGNSGSPALNNKGELVGLNFDRTWETTMSDIMYNPEICRNIMVDIRYILFIIDKYAGATHLIDEMSIN